MHRTRKPLHLSQGKPNSDINITPMVDVVLVLLIIFMVVTPLLEKDIEVKVPDTEQTEDVAEIPANQVVLGVTATGEFSVNMEKIPDEELLPKLKRILAAKREGDKLVFVMADEKTNYGRLVTGLDCARQAGAEILGMMTEIPETAAAPVLGPDGLPLPPGTPPPEGAAPAPAPGGATPTSTAP